MTKTKRPSNLFAVLLAGISACSLTACSLALSLSAGASWAAGHKAEKTEKQIVLPVGELERQRILTSLDLKNAIFLSAFNRPVVLPEQPNEPDSATGTSATADLSLASAALLPLFSAPAGLYEQLKNKELVQIISDVEVFQSQTLSKNLFLTLKEDSPQLMALKELSKRQGNDSADSLLTWHADGSEWYATIIDGRHLLISSGSESGAKIASRFSQNTFDKPVPSTLSLIPDQLNSLLQLPTEPDLWQVFNVSTSDKPDSEKFSSATYLEPGTDTIKAVICSNNQKAPEQFSRELSDFKEPAKFELQKTSADKFTVTISGADSKSTKVKVFLLLLTGILNLGQ